MTAWKFRGDSGDPVEKRRRELAEQQRRLAAQMNELEAKLEAEKNPPPPTPKEAGPPVWHLEEEESFTRPEESNDLPRNKRVLRAQRQRDFINFLKFFVPLAIILAWLIQRLLSS